MEPHQGKALWTHHLGVNHRYMTPRFSPLLEPLTWGCFYPLTTGFLYIQHFLTLFFGYLFMGKANGCPKGISL